MARVFFQYFAIFHNEHFPSSILKMTKAGSKFRQIILNKCLLITKDTYEICSNIVVSSSSRTWKLFWSDLCLCLNQ